MDSKQQLIIRAIKNGDRTGVTLNKIKRIIGKFHLIDPKFLRTIDVISNLTKILESRNVSLYRFISDILKQEEYNAFYKSMGHSDVAENTQDLILETLISHIRLTKFEDYKTPTRVKNFFKFL